MDKFDYKIDVAQYHTVEILVPAHMVAVILADKLGYPPPLPGPECEVNDSLKCRVIYRAAEDTKDSVPITLMKEPPKEAPKDESNMT